jgi:phosphoglycerate kinase
MQALEHPKRPMLAIVGGAKVSSKLDVLDALTDRVDQLIVGGGIANTFLAAEGVNVGKSLMEKSLIPNATRILDKIRRRGGSVPLPIDVVVAKTFDQYADFETKAVDQLADDDMILDVGPKTSELFAKSILNAKTILWNGPVGVFEFESFSQGTRSLAQAVGSSEAYSLAGGGDTIAAIEAFHVEDKISYISTGGGAFLELVEGKKLPALEILKIKARG